MDHKLLKRVLADQIEIIKGAKIIPRGFHFESKANYVLTGLRRAGKSTLLYKQALDLVTSGVSWEQIIFINFEDERLYNFSAMDFNDILEVQAELSAKDGYFFFDEIQNIPGWEKFCRRLADMHERVYVTGSNAAMLSHDIATTLGGRFFMLQVPTYSFGEFLQAQEIAHDANSLLATKSRGVLKRNLLDFLTNGSFPETVNFADKRSYISSVYLRVLLGDIVSRNKIRNENAIRLLMRKLAESVCTEISFSRLYAILKTIGVKCGKATVIDYIEYAKSAYIIFAIKNYVASFADKESSPKYYFSDNGLLNLFLLDENSALLDNAVALALVRKYHDEVYFYHSVKTGIDLDFYLPLQKTAIQVAWTLSESSFDREIAALIKLAKASAQALRLVIVTYEDERVIEQDGFKVEVVPLLNFLLES